jgi:hypothetical protein
LYALPMCRTLGRCCALWLAAQILLPFTAPFATCEFADLFGSQQQHHRSPLAPVVPPSSHVNDDYAFAPPLATASGRLRLKVVSQLDPSNAGKVVPALSRDLTLAAAAGEQDRLHERTTVLRL